MPNLALPTNIVPGTTPTFEVDVEAAWAELNRLSRDTGLRDITPMLINGWTATSVRVQRIVDRTYWEFFNLNGSAATDSTLLTFEGSLVYFRPPAGTESGLFRGDTTVQSPIRVSTVNIRMTTGFVSVPSTILAFNHRCSAGWPTDPPGTPV